MYKDLITALTLQIYFDLKAVTQNDLYNVSRIVDLPQCSALSDARKSTAYNCSPLLERPVGDHGAVFNLLRVMMLWLLAYM